MSETERQFRVTRRGYDPGEVDRVVADLAGRADAARRQAEQLQGRVRELEARASEEQVTAGPASFGHLGERVGQILTLADEEAAALVERARADITAEHEASLAVAQVQRDEADHYATQQRSAAETDAARILEDARRTADDRIDSADRDAAARLQEAEAVYEDQRAKAAKAAADFETTLAHRRKLAEEEYEVQMEDLRDRLADLERQIEQQRADSDAERAEATQEAQRMVHEAQEKASSMVSEAKLTASRVRSDSERELAAASQRRDAINAQLGNVRQMLATLTGAAPAGLIVDDAPLPEMDGEGDRPVADQPRGTDGDTAAGEPGEGEPAPDPVEADAPDEATGKAAAASGKRG